MTKYIEAFSWTDSIDRFVKENVTERPLLNVCSGANYFGDVQVEKFYFPKDWFGCNGTKIKADMCQLPIKDDSFGAVFCDPPWDKGTKAEIAVAMKEFIRVAPVVYVMSPWVWGSSAVGLDKVWVRLFPGVNNAILITKYRRKTCDSKLSEVRP